MNTYSRHLSLNYRQDTYIRSLAYFQIELICIDLANSSYPQPHTFLAHVNRQSTAQRLPFRIHTLIEKV